MPTLISGSDSLDCWRAACAQLCTQKGCETQDLIVEIESVGIIKPAWLEKFNPLDFGGNEIRDVVNTIFPQKTWKNSLDRNALYARYAKANRRGKHRRWGTYFQRLISFGGSGVNQLERAIVAIGTWKNTPRSAICFHFSSPEIDSLKPLGSPCLQAIQLHCHDGRIDASAFYRNHDYFNKALGNFIGIGRLINFISEETGRQSGGLVCYSTHAYSQVSKKTLVAISK